MDSPIEPFKENIRQALVLLEIHKKVTGTARGRRFKVEVLNKSCVVLTTACWEAFVEDTVSSTLDFLLKNCNSPRKLPTKLLRIVATEVKIDKHELKVFDLAGDGWKSVLSDHRAKMAKKFIGTFHTPSHENIDALFTSVIGLDHLSSNWHWKGCSSDLAKFRLEEYVHLRNSIAHRVKTSKGVQKKDAKDYTTFIMRLATKTINKTRTHLHSITGKYPWKQVRMGSVR